MIKTRRTKRTFSPEFKPEAIEQVGKYQRDVREVALALELNPDHLRKWIRLYKLVVDLYSRRIIGSALSLTADADLVCRALRNALETRPHDGRLLFHSEQGVQYKSNKYRKLLWHYGVMQSMSRRGNGLDNSPMERVFRSLKSEWPPKGGYGDFSHAVRDINQWISGYYNVYRPHTNNGGLSPCLHEEKWKQAIPVS